jgi:hypothetical protein
LAICGWIVVFCINNLHTIQQLLFILVLKNDDKLIKENIFLYLNIFLFYKNMHTLQAEIVLLFFPSRRPDWLIYQGGALLRFILGRSWRPNYPCFDGELIDYRQHRLLLAADVREMVLGTESF